MPIAKNRRKKFERDFFQKYYHDRRAAVTDLRETQRVAAFVIHYLRFLCIPIKSILDVGCGLCLWRRALERIAPGIRYVGIDPSGYTARRYGSIQMTVGEIDTRSQYDLVVCQDMLQYLSDAEAAEAIQKFSSLSRYALYCQVITHEDWEKGACERSQTDTHIALRPSAWYRRRLHRDFLPLGGGLYSLKSEAPSLFELEKV